MDIGMDGFNQQLNDLQLAVDSDFSDDKSLRTQDPMTALKDLPHVLAEDSSTVSEDSVCTDADTSSGGIIEACFAADIKQHGQTKTCADLERVVQCIPQACCSKVQGTIVGTYAGVVKTISQRTEESSTQLGCTPAQTCEASTCVKSPCVAAASDTEKEEAKSKDKKNVGDWFLGAGKSIQGGFHNAIMTTNGLVAMADDDYPFQCRCQQLPDFQHMLGHPAGTTGSAGGMVASTPNADIAAHEQQTAAAAALNPLTGEVAAENTESQSKGQALLDYVQKTLKDLPANQGLCATDPTQTCYLIPGGAVGRATTSSFWDAAVCAPLAVLLLNL